MHIVSALRKYFEFCQVTANRVQRALYRDPQTQANCLPVWTN